MGDAMQLLQLGHHFRMSLAMFCQQVNALVALEFAREGKMPRAKITMDEHTFTGLAGDSINGVQRHTVQRSELSQQWYHEQHVRNV